MNKHEKMDDEMIVRPATEEEMKKFKIAYRFNSTNPLKAHPMVNGDVFTIWNKRLNVDPITLEFYKDEEQVLLYEVNEVSQNEWFSTYERTGKSFSIEEINRYMKGE